MSLCKEIVHQNLPCLLLQFPVIQEGANSALGAVVVVVVVVVVLVVAAAVVIAVVGGVAVFVVVFC